MGMLCFHLFISILLSFPTLSFTNAHLTRPRMLLAHHDNGATNINPSCETMVTTPDLTERAFSSLKATPSAGVTSQCKQTYGVLPCTHSIIGNIFLLAAYGYIMYRAAKLLTEGSRRLLVVLGTGIVGGLLLPMVGVLPDTILVLVSGMGGSRAEAQKQVLVGIGLLAGSNVMLLTLLWGSCLILGRCDFEVSNGKLTAKNKTLTNKFDLIGTGVETDDVARVSARIMCASILPFIVAQLPIIFHFSATRNVAVLIASVLSLVGLAAYCIYQACTNKIQQHRKLRAQKLLCKVLVLQNLEHVEDKLVDDKGNVNPDVAKQIFDIIDTDKNKQLTFNEVRVMLTTSYHNHMVPAEVVDHFMKDFDANKNGKISLEEFLSGMKRWCKDINLKKPPHSLEGRKVELEAFLEELSKIKQQEREDETTEKSPTRASTIRSSVLLLLEGTIMAAVFADPLVDAVNNFSRSSHIPSFFVSFVLLPLASNSSEAVSSILFSRRKTSVNMSLTYTQIYGGVAMNNTMSLGIFLAVVYGRHLVWEFSSEVLIICLVTLVMGIMASIRKTFPLWMAGVALLLYPLSLALVAVLDYVAGWK